MRVKDRVLWHLDHDYTEPIRDPLWRHIHLSPGLLAVLESVEFQQLNRIKQLGSAYLVYPGATHTRFAHSLGVYHIAHRMIRALLPQPGCPDLSRDAVSSYLAAALLHDLGHYPYAHSLKDLPLPPHEAIGADMVLEQPLAGLLKNKAGADPELVARIIDESRDDLGSTEVRFFRTLLSGSMDPDKLDYLNRDAYYCGVPYGMQDLDFVLSRIRPNGTAGIALERSGISTVENILFSKYLMYRAVYWHRTVRVATAMVKKALHEALAGGLLTTGDLFGLTDESFHAAFADRREAPFGLLLRVPDRRLYAAVAEVAFDERSPAHRALQDLRRRSELEERLAGLLSHEAGRRLDRLEVLVDLPEAIDFEVRFPVIDGDRVVDYPEAGTVFTPAVISDFTRTLRRFRLMVPPEVSGRLRDPHSALAGAIEGFVDSTAVMG